MVKLPVFPVTGGCQCGAVRYTLKAPPIAFYLCHCTECQKQSSSAFGESLSVRPEDIEISGPTKRYDRPANNGSIQGEFCSVCATRIVHRRHNMCNIKAGTLDDTRWLIPAGHIWTSSKQPFVHIGVHEISYTHHPDSYDAIITRWREMTGT